MRKTNFTKQFNIRQQWRPDQLRLEDGSRVAVMGGGPAGSFFGYFLLEQAERVSLKLQLDIYEPRDYSLAGPPGCNMCAGIVSESLIQMLALDGINLPPSVIQRGMDSYMLHNNAGQVRLETPYLEKRIGAVFRGSGPRGIANSERISFDGFLLERAVAKGANLIRKRVDGVERVDGRIQLKTRGDQPQVYDFLAVATGVNTSALRIFSSLNISYQPPRLALTFVRDYLFGREQVEATFGHTIHFFMLDVEGLDFAAVVPKGDYVTICVLGKVVTQERFEILLDKPAVRSCMPPGWDPKEYVCHCAPRINFTGAVHPYAERMVFLGDCGVARLYKDGIGAAYRAAKAASTAVIYSGIGEADLERYYGRASRRMENDNVIGKIIFALIDLFVKPWRITASATLRMVESEQKKPAGQRWMSEIIWDVFTGSAPYREVLWRMFNPAFWSRMLWYVGISLVRRS